MKKKGFIAGTVLVGAMILTACGSGGGVALARIDAYDRERLPISLPAEINTIISIGPANTEIIAELGFVENIIAADKFSYYVDGLDPAIAVLDMKAIDIEFIIEQSPDIVIITGMMRVPDDNSLRMMDEAGIAVVRIPVSESIAEIMGDVLFLANLLGVQAEGERIVAEMEREIEDVRWAAAGRVPRTVYFEISPEPWMISTDNGMLLNELIEIAGGVNIFADQNGWLAATDEMLLSLDPEVIFTNSISDDAVSEIIARPGFGAISAVRDGHVYRISANASIWPSHNIIIALREISDALCPGGFI